MSKFWKMFLVAAVAVLALPLGVSAQEETEQMSCVSFLGRDFCVSIGQNESQSAALEVQPFCSPGTLIVLMDQSGSGIRRYQDSARQIELQGNAPVGLPMSVRSPGCEGTSVYIDDVVQSYWVDQVYVLPITNLPGSTPLPAPAAENTPEATPEAEPFRLTPEQAEELVLYGVEPLIVDCTDEFSTGQFIAMLRSEEYEAESVDQFGAKFRESLSNGLRLTHNDCVYTVFESENQRAQWVFMGYNIYHGIETVELTHDGVPTTYFWMEDGLVYQGNVVTGPTTLEFSGPQQFTAGAFVDNVRPIEGRDMSQYPLVGGPNWESQLQGRPDQTQTSSPTPSLTPTLSPSMQPTCAEGELPVTLDNGEPACLRPLGAG